MSLKNEAVWRVSKMKQFVFFFLNWKVKVRSAAMHLHHKNGQTYTGRGSEIELERERERKSVANGFSICEINRQWEKVDVKCAFCLMRTFSTVNNEPSFSIWELQRVNLADDLMRCEHHATCGLHAVCITIVHSNSQVLRNRRKEQKFPQCTRVDDVMHYKIGKIGERHLYKYANDGLKYETRCTTPAQICVLIFRRTNNRTSSNAEGNSCNNNINGNKSYRKWEIVLCVYIIHSFVLFCLSVAFLVL